MPQFPRSSGILLHITSLPSEYGIGDLGENAYHFVDFLADAGQSIWQILPLSPTIQCNSPYSSYSAFAGNTLLISPTKLLKDGFLRPEDVAELDEVPSGSQADFEAATKIKNEMLAVSFERFRLSSQCSLIDDFEAFCTTQQWWLNDFALFASLIRHFGNDNWVTWDIGLVQRQRDSLIHWRKTLEREIEREQFAQYLFFKQWQQLKDYANSRGVRLFGDMPIFVSHGSADVWANQSLFSLDENGRRTVVAGVPPDYFSETGQLWGNPLYRWDRLAETDYRWWVQRIRAAFQMFDLLRIDHFRGFEAYWEVSASAENAINGQWVKGPGSKLFEAVRRHLGDLAIVAEDLGLITEEVHQLRNEFEFPGMRVFEFGFDDAEGFHRPDNFPANSVAYTGTHDNDTLMGWYHARQEKKAATGDRDILDRFLSSDTDEHSAHWQMINMVFGSASHTAIVPLQDVLALGNEARMNVPGQAIGNWGWRYQPEQLNEAIANNLRLITEHSGRLQLAAY
ncbi:MAG: 4-alpha-glucanotransferase [Pirellulales bacterium]